MDELVCQRRLLHQFEKDADETSRRRPQLDDADASQNAFDASHLQAIGIDGPASAPRTNWVCMKSDNFPEYRLSPSSAGELYAREGS